MAVAQVVVEFGGEEVMRRPLKGPTMVLGRDAAADIHLDNRALSRRHAQLEKRGAAIWIRDLDSQNGTFVNGERIDEPQPLNTGDVVEVGRYQLRIEGVDQAQADTPVLTLTGPEGRHRFAMVGEEIIIGRAPSCDIAIGHKSISRRHLRISTDGKNFSAEDLGSQNGSKIFGKRIEKRTRFNLGDEIQLSDFTIEVGYLEQQLPTRKGEPEGANKTMMIDRSELAKAAYVDGDFERMRSSAGRLALGRPGTGRMSEEAEDESEEELSEEELSEEELSEETRGTPAASSTSSAPPPPPAASSSPPSDPNPQGRRKSKKQDASKAAEPWATLIVPDAADRDLKFKDDVTIVGEDGSQGFKPSKKLFADQAYLLFIRTQAGVTVSVAGDRRVVTVNGQPHLFSPLSDGDTVEFGELSVVYHR
ncbi:MAG: FHA domain-containing protein [Deltaproteobacteria bacterium]|nr:FHA domain-containing protein [Deltaproteobacteria bacterium]